MSGGGHFVAGGFCRRSGIEKPILTSLIHRKTMTGRGKGGKGLGKGGAKRHRKVLRDNIHPENAQDAIPRAAASGKLRTATTGALSQFPCTGLQHLPRIPKRTGDASTQRCEPAPEGDSAACATVPACAPAPTSAPAEVVGSASSGSSATAGGGVPVSLTVNVSPGAGPCPPRSR